MARNRILLIEDDPDYEKLICHVLTTAANPFDIKSAANLGDGLALLDQHSPELILVDLTLPDSFGYETFLRVRERAHGAPIIVLTGLDDDQVAIQAVEDGAADYLVKTQRTDGSWHVQSRSKPLQLYFESGFPHGKDQFISCAASSWATIALVLACEPVREKSPE